MAGNVGNGCTITFGTSGFVCKILSVGGAFGFSQKAIDVTDMSDIGTDQSSTARGVDLSASGLNKIVEKMEPGSLKYKPLVLRVHHVAAQTMPVAVETITFRSQPLSGQTAGEGFSFSGFVTDYDASFEKDGAVVASMTIQPKSEATELDATV